MNEDERLRAAARLLTRLAEDEALGAITGTIGDLDRREVQGLLRFAAETLRPTEGGGHRELTIHVDGASIGNPGPAGAGVVVLDPNNRKAATICEPLGMATNNVAEYRALILGLLRARELGAARVHVRTDSELMVKQLTGDYRIKDEKLRKLAREAMEIIDSFDYFDIVHVGREENREADRLAKRAAEAGGR